MLSLSSNGIAALANVTEEGSVVRRLAEAGAGAGWRPDCEYLVIRDNESIPPTGFRGYFYFARPSHQPPSNSFLLDSSLNYLQAGDVVRLTPSRNALRTLYRKNSPHNFFLM